MITTVIHQSQQQTALGTRRHIKVGHVDLSVETAAARNLGAWFDRNLSMSTHINKICQSVSVL